MSLEIKLTTAVAANGDFVALLMTDDFPDEPVKLILKSGFLWNRSGLVNRIGNMISAESDNGKIDVFTTGRTEEDPFIDSLVPYLPIVFEEKIGISTGKNRSIEEIETIIADQEKKLFSNAEKYDDLAEQFLAIQAGIAWNIIYDPKNDRVIPTIGRQWNAEYGGYCLFGWDNFFLSYMQLLDSPEVAVASFVEHLDSATEEGFIPNDDRGNGMKSFDRSQPPVGVLIFNELLKFYDEDWFKNLGFYRLLNWNRWWYENRLNESLLSYGSHVAKNPYNEPHTHSAITALYESGMDDSPMYDKVAFNPEKNTIELQDVGLNSLYLAECKILKRIAFELDEIELAAEIDKREQVIKKEFRLLWRKDKFAFLNYRTDFRESSERLSPTMFYPLMCDISEEQRRAILDNYYLNPNKFYDELMIASISKDDVTFPKQRYWKGAIWPPLNFLVYYALKYANENELANELAKKSAKIFMQNWNEKRLIAENYSSITGTGDDIRLSSDPFHSWGCLMGFLEFVDKQYLVR
jgi:neutral trehalase